MPGLLCTLRRLWHHMCRFHHHSEEALATTLPPLYLVLVHGLKLPLQAVSISCSEAIRLRHAKLHCLYVDTPDHFTQLTTYNRAAPTEPVTIYDDVTPDSSTYGSAVSYTGSITQAGGQSNPVTTSSGASPTSTSSASSATTSSGGPEISTAASSSSLSTDAKVGVGVGVGVGVPLLLAALGICIFLARKHRRPQQTPQPQYPGSPQYVHNPSMQTQGYFAQGPPAQAWSPQPMTNQYHHDGPPMYLPGKPPYTPPTSPPPALTELSGEGRDMHEMDSTVGATSPGLSTVSPYRAGSDYAGSPRITS